MPRILLRTNSEAVSFGLLVHQQIGVGIEVADAAAFLPLGLVGRVALVLARPRAPTWSAWDSRRWRTACRRRRRGARDTRPCALRSRSGSIGPLRAGRLKLAVRWKTCRCLAWLGDDRDHLHARRAGADHADPQAAEVDALMRPQAGVVPLALEVLQALEVGHPRRREIARRHDAVARADLLAAVGLERPFARPRRRTAPTRCGC